MSMSDCEMCWSTPCDCGHAYRNNSVAKRIALAAVILGVDEDDIRKGVEIPERHPQADKVAKPTSAS